MTEQNNAGGQPVEKATEINGNMPPVEPKVQEEAKPQPEVSQVNTAELLAAQEEKIAKLTEERNNYRKGMLKAKGKTTGTFDEEEDDIESIVERKVQETLYSSKIQEAQKEKDELIAKTLRENEELRQAISNRPPSPSSRGVSADTIDEYKEKYTSSQYWSPEQIKDLENRGLNPDTVYANMQVPGTSGQPINPNV